MKFYFDYAFKERLHLLIDVLVYLFFLPEILKNFIEHDMITFSINFIQFFNKINATFSKTHV